MVDYKKIMYEGQMRGSIVVVLIVFTVRRYRDMSGTFEVSRYININIIYIKMIIIGMSNTIWSSSIYFSLA